MTDETAANPRARRDRADETGASRRDRFEATARDPSLRRFGVADAILDLENFTYRAALDEKTRIMELTQQDDYDFVLATGDSTTEGGQKGVLRYQSGTVDGKPQFTYLLRKPKQFADEHRKRRLDKLKTEERARLTEVPADAREKGYKPG